MHTFHSASEDVLSSYDAVSDFGFDMALGKYSIVFFDLKIG